MLKTVKGYTLIELIMVITIIGILGVSIYLQWPGLSLNLGAQATQVASDIRYTQMLAVSKNKSFQFVKTSSTTYQIRDATGTPITTSRGGTTLSLYSGISFGNFGNLPNDLIVFKSDGEPYTDLTTTPLAATATIPLVSSSGTRVISILPETGRVTVS